MQTIDALKSLVVNHPFLSGLNPHFYHLFGECALRRPYGKGQEIFHEGGNADHFYLIQSGKVALETFVPGRGMVTIQLLSPGEALGWSWLFAPYRWQFDVRAIDPVGALSFDGACLRGKCAEDPALGYALLTLLAAVFVERLQETRLRLLDLYARVDGGG